MPDFFEFKRTDAYLTQRLTAQELGAITVWQSDRLDYQFSFHTQHEAGWPCYLSEPDGPGRNLPKYNLKVPILPVSLLQGASVKNTHVGEDFRRVIAGNIPIFQKLARLYYEGAEVVRVAVKAWAVVFTCNKSPQAKSVAVKISPAHQVLGATWWSNAKRYAKAPNCPLHKTNGCMVGVPEQIEGKTLTECGLVFDGNGEAQPG